MGTMSFESARSPRSFLWLTLAGFLGALIGALLISRHGVAQGVDSFTLPVAGRTLNQFMAIVLTCIALIVPLTANLYSPKLVTLYVTHPLIVSMLSLLLTSHAICLVLNFIPPTKFSARVLVDVLALIYLVVIMGALPFLYKISQFLRPNYFMTILTRKGVDNLKSFSASRISQGQIADLFETIDVITNIAITGMHRGDRQLVLIALQSMDVILVGIIGSDVKEPYTWRRHKPYFVPGLAVEGQEHLMRERIWPEAYVLAQLLKVMEIANRRQQEILSEFASHLVESARLALAFGRHSVVNLHIMAFNTLMREAIEERDLRRFQNLSYHYRLLIDCFRDHPEQMHEATQHLLHYGKMAAKQSIHFAMETVVYDMGELVLSLAKGDEARAEEMIRVWAGPLWQDCIEDSGLRKKSAWRTVLRLYWETKAADCQTISEALFWRYLSDEAIHREQLELVLDENRELHFEFNDRMMRFAHFSPRAEAMAREFLEGAWA